MSMSENKPLLAVVSPFVDKRHGTERRVAEWLSRLSQTFEIHLYSQRAEDLDTSQIAWHKIPRLSGPHLFNYIWWFVANHLWRAWDRRFRALDPDIVFSPGINCLDADAVSVHVVFAEYLRQNESSLLFRNHPIRELPRLAHRKMYYWLIARLERSVYRNPEVSLILISRRTSRALEGFYGRKGELPVVYSGLDQEIFNPRARMKLRENARREIRLKGERTALLLIGNDWQNKGLPVLLETLVLLDDLTICLMIVGRDNPSPFRKYIDENHLQERVIFLPPRRDVEYYYAAADIYVGPSREDAFGQPPAEAMACGLPVITTITCGVSELITDGVDGMVLRDPLNTQELAAKIRQLHQNPEMRKRLGERAAETARRLTWDQNGKELTKFLLEILQKKNSAEALTLHQGA
jgi:glycosyltransferase involved in cell wall biosynthesis